MYEENNVSTLRRILILIATGVAIVIVLWLAVWLVFFHHDNTATKKPSKPNTSASQPVAQPPAHQPSNDNKPSQTTQNTSSASTTLPALANTGPGNIILPVGVAVVVGASAEYWRVRRKLSAE